MSVKPLRLNRGDAVGVIAPASPPDKIRLERSFSFLKECGLEIKIGRNVYQSKGFLAGTDDERAADIQEMFSDPEVKAVICAGGGYGTARLAERIDYSLIAANPKIFWGYSDITFLHQAIFKKTGLVTFHGAMLASDFGREHRSAAETKRWFGQLFKPAEMIYSDCISPLETRSEGKAAGCLTGGNLTLLASTLGTPFEVETAGRLLLIEDINEEPRKVDRMLNQLYMSGKLTEAAGLVIGDFTGCDPKDEQSLTLDEVLSHYIELAGIPAVSGFKIGHCSPNVSVPLGAGAFLDADQKRLIMEPGVI